jgi:hypothetical protein
VPGAALIGTLSHKPRIANLRRKLRTRRKLLLAILGLLFICLCAAGALILRPTSYSLESVHDFPIYNGGTNVAIRVRQPDVKGTSLDHGESLAFDTQDQRPAIFDYYKTWFLKNGWHYDGVGRIAQIASYSKDTEIYDGVQFTHLGRQFLNAPWFRFRYIQFSYHLTLMADPHLNSCTADSRVLRATNSVCFNLGVYKKTVYK